MRPWLLAGACLLVAACAGRSIQTPPAPLSETAEQHQQQRAQRLAQTPAWALGGRVAVSSGRDGGSGRLDWRQQGQTYHATLSAPVTRQSWTLAGDPGQARLEGVKGGPQTGADAGALLRQATGWDIPIQALAHWLRGLPAETAQAGPATLGYGADGRLQRIEQGGWVVDYSDWSAVDLGTGQIELPHRLNAQRGPARVRLIIDAWQPGGTPPP